MSASRAQLEAELERAWGSFRESEKRRIALERNLAHARLATLEEAAKVAESYEPECESCPRGVATAIRALVDVEGGAKLETNSEAM